jgi:hypothetical protein
VAIASIGLTGNFGLDVCSISLMRAVDHGYAGGNGQETEDISEPLVYARSSSARIRVSKWLLHSRLPRAISSTPGEWHRLSRLALGSKSLRLSTRPELGYSGGLSSLMTATLVHTKMVQCTIHPRSVLYH